jgi:Na+-translocating ferredoxin:NAD+ oxidoreductase RnfG subunit
MTLMEVIIALAIFSIAAVALVGAINQMGETVILTRTMRQVEISLASLLDEYSKAPQIQELEKDLDRDEAGVGYHIEVKEVENIKNRAGQPITGIYRIAVTASWKEDGKTWTKQAETLRNISLYAPGQ